MKRRIADGSFINTIVIFVIIGAVLFVIVEAYERTKDLRSRKRRPRNRRSSTCSPGSATSWPQQGTA